MLPVGLQLVAGLWQEQKILDAGYAWESANDWKRSGSHGTAGVSMLPKL
jgi:amidase